MSLFRRRRTVPVSGGGTYELPEGRRRLDAASADADDVRNLALAVWIQWGPGGGLTRPQRLAAAVSGLDGAALQTLADEVSGVEEIATGYMWEHSPTVDGHPQYTPRRQIDALVLARHPWVDAANLSSIYNHACYVTWHG